jgi:hypothetical protein
MSTGALYLYAIAPARAAAPCAAPVPTGSPVTVLRDSGLAALVSLVPAEAFTGPDAAAADPAWVADSAAAHHRVVAALAATGACLPLGFGTLFGSEAALARWLAARAPSARAALDRLDGQAEWVLRLSADTASLAAEAVARDPALRDAAAAAEAASPGRAVLLRKRLDRAARAVAETRLAALAGAQAAHLAAIGAAPEAEPPPPGSTHAWRCLHPLEAAPDALVHPDIAAGDAVTAHLAGPYPPYGYARAVLEAA